MKCYFLLRDNRESGPFTQEQLKACNLVSSDLIWIEGESHAWEHPGAIGELQAFTKESSRKEPSPQVKTSPVVIPVPSLQQYRKAIGEEEMLSDNNGEEHPAYYYKSKTVFRQRRAASNDSFSIGSGVFGAVILLVGLGLCAFVFINMLNQFIPKQRAASSEAVEIKSEILPVSNAAHAAHASLALSTPAQASSVVPAPVADTTNLKTALQKKTAKLTSEAAKKKLTAKADTTKTQIVADAQTSSKDEADSNPPEEKSEPVPAANRTPSLQLSANDYKVGLFGGVSNLEISVTNPSGQKINKATIEVEFLKPNGSVAKSQTVTAENISPNGSVTVSVPSSSRGVKVRYHVVSIDLQN